MAGVGRLMAGACLALDWGTTNLRAWIVDGSGRVAHRRDFALGVGSLAPGEAERRFHDEVRPAMDAEALPAILCGMIGSNLGWTAIPYLDCPAGFEQMSRALHRIEAPGAPVWIVPGLRAARPDGSPDVMRGEETHVFGWAIEDPARSRGEHLICHPGTHAKWVRMVDGRIETFVTSMTGELFAILRRHSALRVAEAEDDEAAFALGLAAAGDGRALASRLFTARSRVVGGDLAPRSAESYLSGLLIGAEAASTPGLLGIEQGASVSIIGDLGLCGRYAQALETCGFRTETFDGDGAVLAGLGALFKEAMTAC
jgi:2-dehydro-3-deoxygalactonokinase